MLHDFITVHSLRKYVPNAKGGELCLLGVNDRAVLSSENDAGNFVATVPWSALYKIVFVLPLGIAVMGLLRRKA